MDWPVPFGLMTAINLVGHDRGAVLDEDAFQHTVLGRRHLEYNLVGFDIDQRLVTLDGIARLLVPAGDHAVADRFREGRAP